MEPEERYYNIKKLNLLFAVVSVVLLIAIIATFVDDYSRGWKKYQKQFRRLEIAKTRQRYDEELSHLKNQADYQDLLKKIADTKTQFNQKSSERKPLELKLAKLQVQNDLNQQRYQFAKAQFDSARYEYEEALAHQLPDTAAKKQKFDRLGQETGKLRLALEESGKAVQDQTAKIQTHSASLKQLEKDRSVLAKQADLLARRLKKIDPKEMSFANRIADSIRDLPIVDFMNPNYRIEQIVIKDITDDVNFVRVPKVDRCTTCHTGALKPGFEDAPQPFRTHPNLELFLSNNSPHPLEEFGCTSCHNGRGRGVDFVSAAHMPSAPEQKNDWARKYRWHQFEFTETPMYPMRYVEASCLKCHAGQEIIKGAEKLNLGLNIMEKAGCFGCHFIDKYRDWPRVGPNLTHLASKITQDWAFRWIRDPKSFRHTTWMPSFFGQSNNSDEVSAQRTDQEIHAIVHYLFEKSEKFQEQGMPIDGDAEKGEELAASVGCLGCHILESKRAPTDKLTLNHLRREHGPNLSGLGTKTNKKWLYNWLKDPNRYHPATRMPNLRLSDEEAADIAAYLSQSENNDFIKKPIAPMNKEILDTIVRGFLVKMMTVSEAEAQMKKMTMDEKLSFAGQKLIKHYGCFGCHIIPGFENEKPIGTELSEEGSKSVHRLDFGFVHIDHTNYAWFTQKLKNPRVFDQNRVRDADERLKMPNFNFSDEEIEAVVTAVLGFVKDKPAASKIAQRSLERQFIDAGERIVREFNCHGCHVMEGEGGAIQPTITDWLVKFGNRGEADAKAVTINFSPPNLIGEGEKVQAEWLFNFIHKPQVIRPWLKARMPTFASLNTANVNTLVRYFSYLDKQDFPFTDKTGYMLTPEEYQAAEKLFSDDYFSCGKCHIVGDKMPSGSPDSWAPDFALAKTRLKPDWIIKWLKNPQALLPGTKMPTFFDPNYFDSSGPDDVLGGDENKQIQVLRDYLLTLSGQGESKAIPQSQPQTQNENKPVSLPTSQAQDP